MRRSLITLILTICAIACAPTAHADGPCLGDFDNDGDVGVLDLLLMLGSWGPCPLGECVDPFICGISEFPASCDNDPDCFCLADMNGAGVCVSDGLCSNLTDCPDGNCPPGFLCAAFTCCNPMAKCAPDCMLGPENQPPAFRYGDHTMRGIAGVDFPLNTATAGLECVADIDNDLEVGVLDLLALLGAWGPCP